MGHFIRFLTGRGFSVRIIGDSAADLYFGTKTGTVITAATDAPLADMAKYGGEMHFAGIEGTDTVVEDEGRLYFMTAADSGDFAGPRVPLAPADTDVPVHCTVEDIKSFSWNPADRLFSDPGQCFPLLHDVTLRKKARADTAPARHDIQHTACLDIPEPETMQEAADTAVFLAKYPFRTERTGHMSGTGGNTVPLPPLEQKALLIRILEGKWSGTALSYLRSTGFVGLHWPELEALSKADHSKDFHPEGNGWNHTVETLQYRKSRDIILSLALLLHDIGKPVSKTGGPKMYDRHAEAGAYLAERFLRRLEFDEKTVESVVFLVKNHMMTAALPRLPLFRTQSVMDSPLAPLLLELYRCDEASSFKNPGGYYAACRTYRAYAKHRHAGRNT